MTDFQNMIRTMAETEIEVDVVNRILRRCVVSTRGLATDGWIIVPDGISFEDFLKNPVVTARHIEDQEDAPPMPVTIGRCLAVRNTPDGTETETQFADTQLGRDWAYLYGVNERKEVYCRAWSINARILEAEAWSFDKARQFAGAFWSQETADVIAKRQTQVNVATRSMVRAYSAVELGADRFALSRAAAEGNRMAGTLMLRTDLKAANEALAELKRNAEADRTQLRKLEEEIKAIRGQEASAAARRDSEALLSELRRLLDLARSTRSR